MRALLVGALAALVLVLASVASAGKYAATISVESQTATTATYAAALTKGVGPLWVSQSCFDATDVRVAVEFQPVLAGAATFAIGGTFPDGQGGFWTLDPAYCSAFAFVWPNTETPVGGPVTVTP